MDPPPHLLRQADQREGGWGPSEGVRCRGKRRDSLSCQTGSSGEGGGSVLAGKQRGRLSAWPSPAGAPWEPKMRLRPEPHSHTEALRLQGCTPPGD